MTAVLLHLRWVVPIVFGLICVLALILGVALGWVAKRADERDEATRRAEIKARRGCAPPLELMPAPFAIEGSAVAIDRRDRQVPYDYDRDSGAAERLAAAIGRPSGDVVALGADLAPVPERDLRFERAFTMQAAEAGGVGFAELIRFAEQRAGDEPVRDPGGRDFVLEVLEELADARNYLVWLAAWILTQPGHDPQLLARIAEVLILVARAFDATIWLRDLTVAA